MLTHVSLWKMDKSSCMTTEKGRVDQERVGQKFWLTITHAGRIFKQEHAVRILGTSRGTKTTQMDPSDWADAQTTSISFFKKLAGV